MIFGLLTSKQTKVLPRINDRTTSFNPHGVHLLNENNANYLFVVNHYDKYKKNEIIRYVLKGDTLYYDTSFKYSSKINAVCAVSKNRFYITNDKVLNGKLVEYANAKFHTLAKGIHFPNGVNIKDDYLYYTTTLSGKVKKAKIIGVGKIEKSQKIAKIKGADNIRFYKNDLITTSHPKFRKFLKHLKNKDNPSPCDVYSIDLNTFNKKKLYSSSGVPISAVSTAILYNKQLYLAQVFEPFILAVDLE